MTCPRKFQFSAFLGQKCLANIFLTCGGNYSELEKFKGVLLFASNVSATARSNLFYISQEVAQYQREFTSGCEPVLLHDNLKAEILYWSDIDNHKSYEIKETRKVCLTLYSDASSFRWAASARINGLDASVSGDFKEEMAERNIYDKETYAVGKLVELIPPNTTAIISIDNQALCAGLRKGMLGSEFANEIFKNILKRQQDQDLDLFFNWINTHEMAERGVDAQSRGKFRSDMFLSKKGVDKARRSVPFNIELDWYTFTNENPFESRFCSIDLDLDDSFCTKQDFISHAEKFKNRALESGSWCFPPANLAKTCISVLGTIKLGDMGGIALLVPASWVPLAIRKFRKVGDVRAFKFACKNNKTLFNKKNRNQLSLVVCTGSGYDKEDEEQDETGSNESA